MSRDHAVVNGYRRTGLKGHLRLVCAADEAGKSYLREQSFCAPFHLSKPFEDAGTLVVNVVNPTAGIFPGDEMTVQVCVESGARMLLTAPSATRVYRKTIGVAKQAQHFTVQKGAFLEILPEIFIPQSGAAYQQQTHIEVEAGGSLLFFESLAPGRVASGEAFAFENLDWFTSIKYGGKSIVRERFSLSPKNGSLNALTNFYPASYYGCCFAVGSDFLEPNPQQFAETSGGIIAGYSRLVEAGWVVKIIVRGSVELRKAMRLIREHFYGSKRLIPNLRRA